MKVYLDVVNFSKIYIDYVVYNSRGEKVYEDHIQSSTNIVELPTFESCKYVLNYYAENNFGKTDIFTWEFNYSTNILPPKEINVELQANGTVAFVSWTNCDVEYYTLRVFKGSTYTDLIVQSNSYLYKPTDETETVSFAVACKSSGLFSYATPTVTISKIPSNVEISNPPQPSIEINSYEYIHSPLSILLKLDVIHGNRDDIVGTVVMVTNTPTNPKWITQVVYKNFNQATFQVPWNGTNSMQIQIKAYSFSSTGLLSDIVTRDYSIPKFTQSIAAPTLSVLAAGFDTAYCFWDPPQAIGPLKYDLQYSENSSFTAATTITTTDNSYTIQFQFSSNKTIYFRVKAYDNWGNESNFSTTISATITSKQQFENNLNQQLTQAQNQISNLNSLTKQLEGAMFSNFINYSFSDSDGNPSLRGWYTYLGSGSVVTVTDGIGGKYALQNDYNSQWWVYSDLMPVDPNKTYVVEAYARTVSSGTSGRFFLAVVLFDANKNFISGDGSWWYYAASQQVPPSSWTRYSGIFGYGTSRPFPNNARYMAVGVILNHQSGTSGNRRIQVQMPRIIQAFDTTYIRELSGDKIVAGSITGDKIAAGAISANHIASKSITADKLSVTSLSAISSNIGDITAGRLRDSTGNLFTVDLNSQQLKIAHSSYPSTPYFAIGRNIVTENNISKTGLVFDGSKIPAGSEKIAKFKEVVLESTAISASKIETKFVTIDSIQGLVVKGDNNDYVLKANNAGVVIKQLELEDNSISGSKITDVTLSPRKLKRYNIGVHAMQSISFTPTVVSSSLVARLSGTVYGKILSSSYSIGIGYRITAGFVSFPSSILISSITCSLVNQKIRLSINLNDNSPQTSVIQTSTEALVKTFVTGSYTDDLSVIYSHGRSDIDYMYIFSSGETVSKTATEFTRAVVRVALSGFTSTRFYNFSLPSQVRILYNNQWQTGNVLVTGSRTYTFEITVFSLSTTVDISCNESTIINHLQAQNTVVGGMFWRAEALTPDAFLATYMPSSIMAWQRGTVNSRDQTGWMPQTSVPLYILFSHGGPGTITVAWWWNFYESFEQNVDVEVQILYNDDTVAVFTSSNGVTWTKNWERGTSGTRALLTYSNVHSLVIMLNNIWSGILLIASITYKL